MFWSEFRACNVLFKLEKIIKHPFRVIKEHRIILSIIIYKVLFHFYDRFFKYIFAWICSLIRWVPERTPHLPWHLKVRTLSTFMSSFETIWHFWDSAVNLMTIVLEKKEKEKLKKRERTRVPAESGSIPGEVPYLLIGGGTAAFSAFRSIKSRDPKAKVS